MENLQVHNSKICLAICTPIPGVSGPDGTIVLDTISPLWHRARAGLSHPTNFNMVEYVIDRLAVDDARNKAAAQALSQKPVPPEFLFFLDYDVLPHFDALTKLFFRARCNPKIDIFAGVYCCKYQNPPDPLIYAGNGQGPFWDWTIGDLLTTDSHDITSVHMGLTLIRTSLFQRMKDEGVAHGDGTDLSDEPFFLTRSDKRAVNGGVFTRSGTEDIYFCDKARSIGAKIMVDTSVLAGHHDKKSGAIYGLPWDEGPAGRALWLPNRTGKAKDELEAEKENKKICLDVGAGDLRREWEGYKTYTTDIRAEAKPDYVQDTRLLNLPDDHFDMVATSHHLEHFGRYEQEKIWANLVKVLKPGGVVEFVIPNVEWAAAKIVNNDIDERVFDVLYGAQERFEFERDWNTHYFAYTPAIAKALAEEAGLVDVKIRTYNDDPNLKWELVLTACKPEPSGELKQWDLPLLTIATEESGKTPSEGPEPETTALPVTEVEVDGTVITAEAILNKAHEEVAGGKVHAVVVKEVVGTPADPFCPAADR